jgi:ABC-type glycerol-3-phosphate transport system permease component
MKPRLTLVPLYAALLFFAALTLLPFVWMMTSAVKSQTDFFTSFFLPRGDGPLGIAWERLTLDNFRRLFREFPVARAMLNSFFYASISSSLATLACSMAGYGLAKFPFRGRTFVTALVLGALIIPASLLIAPSYRLLWQLGLLNSYSGLILPVLAPAFGVFLFRQAMLNTVPKELLESARIDGAGEFRIFFTIVIPLVRPMIGAFLMITFLGAWNNFIGPQIVLQEPDVFPLSVAINNLRGVYATDYGLIMSGTLLSIAPVMCLFLLLQKEFISGLTSGAVKG